MIFAGAASVVPPQPTVFGIPRGDLTLALVAALLAVLGYFIRRAFGQWDSMGRQQDKHTEALAVLVANAQHDRGEVEDVRRRLEEMNTRQTSFGQLVATMGTRLDEHLAQSARDLEDIRTRITPGASRPRP